MVSDWWLQNHPDAKTLNGAEWLVGFYDRLKEDDLHVIDREYLTELVTWHAEKKNVEIAPSCEVIVSTGEVVSNGDV